MLPGFRFLFAATLLTVSLLVFGLGAAALLRASRERFASLPKQPMAAPVLTQTADAAPPTLSMLRIEPASVEARMEPVPTPADTLSPTDRIATLSVAPRVEEAPSAPPIIVEPKPDVKADVAIEPPATDVRTEPATNPLVQPPPSSVEATVATSVQAEPQLAAKPDAIETPAPIASEPAPQLMAALPEPDVTGSTPAQQAVIEPPLVNARPIRNPPTPRDRPADADVVAALPDPVAAAPATDTAKLEIRKRRPVVKRAAKPKRRVVSRPALPRPAAQNPASPFGASPFGT